MESSEDKNWATRYLLDPLNEPDPSAETGPGSSFRPDAPQNQHAAKLPSPPTSPNRPSKNPFRMSSFSSNKGPPREPGMISPIGRSSSVNQKSSPTTMTTTELPYRSNSHRVSTHSRNTSGNYPTPPYQPNSPSHRQEVFSEYNSTSPNQSPSPGDSKSSTGRRRGSSLPQRYPGDNSHKPLAQLSHEKYIADKSKHVTRKHHIAPDTIDALDTIGPGGTAYHHGGPYDATLLARNNSYLSSPVQAVRDSNAEAIRATPPERIIDSVRGHRPLDGVASYPPGTTDRNNHLYNYTEGENMMIGTATDEPQGGAYKRWPGMQYSPGDIKGKSEPSYTIEKQLREDKERSRRSVEGKEGIEMTSSSEMPRTVDENGIRRNGSGNKRLSGGGLKKRIGSIKKHLGSGDA